MTDTSKMIEAFEARVRRREQRREFLVNSARAGVAAASLSLLAACGSGSDGDNDLGSGPTPPPPPPPSGTLGDADVLNFALNLEYLESNFYLFAATGAGLPTDQQTGVGILGAATGGRQVNFTDPEVRRLARELAANERAHVAFLRSQLGTSAIAQPAIDIGTGATSAFTAAARAAGVVSSTQTFDPYASDENFLLGAFIFEDVGVTAYKGAAPLLTNKTFLEASAGILAVEAYHAGLIRTTLYGKGLAAPALITATNGISNARDSLDGTSDLDQGITVTTGTGTGATTNANIVPADADAIAFSRTTGQVLNIAYLTKAQATSGGFFPAGVNGAIRTSTAQP